MDPPPLIQTAPLPASAEVPADRPVPQKQPYLTIDPPTGWQPLEVAELWRFRELFWIFADRDIKVRYKQTILGGAWALIQPLMFTVLGTVVFSRLAGTSTDGVRPVFLFYLVSQLPWMLFNTGLQASAMSLVGAQGMIKKIYFPRLVIPASAVVVTLVDFLVQFGLVVAVLLALPLIPRVQAFVPPIQVLLVPAATLWAFLAALAIGLPLAALNVEYRDVRYVIPFVTQFMIFAAPVFWSVEKIPAAWRPVYGLLPVAGPIDFFRWCVLGTPAHPMMWLVGFVAAVLTLLAGLAYFRRVEDSFADVV
jgi:lipopolysaccharide transport system permease protein